MSSIQQMSCSFNPFILFIYLFVYLFLLLFFFYSFRWHGNPALPDGLIYEGVSEQPLQVRLLHVILNWYWLI